MKYLHYRTTHSVCLIAGLFSFLLVCFNATILPAGEKPLDRHAIVSRHDIKTESPELQLPLGNGEFCLTIDGTGLQTFGGSSLSHWGWHTAPLPDGFRAADVPPTGTWQTGRNTGPDDALPKGFDPVRNWMRGNAHMANLGRIRLVRGNGKEIKPGDIVQLRRHLELWTGIHTSRYTLDGRQVETSTVVACDDRYVVKIVSPLLVKDAIRIELDFPYPDGEAKDWCGNFTVPGKHTTTMVKKSRSLCLSRHADTFDYGVVVRTQNASLLRFNSESHTLTFASDGSDTIEIEVVFNKNISEKPQMNDVCSFAKTANQTCKAWQHFWTTGGAIDLSGSTDPRWKELERRIVLSQYLMRCNSVGSWPSSESGLLTADPWHGRFHMEMVWWHLAHYFLWGRQECADDALTCYERFKPMATQLARQLNYAGYKWGKSMEPGGRTSPWRGNQVLLWKQPHPIFFADLEYRIRPTQATLDKWSDIIEGTAEHMADYVTRDKNGVYHLDPVMPPSEIGVTSDTVFDLAYWRYGLNQANRWRQLRGLARNPKWDEIAKNLAPLPVVNDPVDGKVFIHAPAWTDSYTKRNWEHPDLIGVFGMLPPVDGVDRQTAKRTVAKVARQWNWNRCWGWDFPWIAMAAARTGQSKIAVDMLLCDSSRNVYDVRGVNTGGPCPYLPGNGGLLYAVAMMAAGWDGAPDTPCPGFPQDGTWNVRFEGLHKAP
ncbi:MAG: hypothetical protein PHQ75_11320 [Thermoguttaceae bacterium]|nr:hypothetical protein [Thermoguttaceae bacterium]